MNKKANLPIIILVIGVLVVSVLALLSFYRANINTEDVFSGIGKVEKVNAQIENNPKGNYYEEETSGFDFLWWEEKVIFSVEYKPLS